MRSILTLGFQYDSPEDYVEFPGQLMGFNWIKANLNFDELKNV
jgi:hypothetical protein